MSDPTPNLPTTTTSSTSPPPLRERCKPRAPLLIATAFGLGYLPKAPGTWGSLGGIVLAMIPYGLFSLVMTPGTELVSVSLGPRLQGEPLILFQMILTVIVGLIGVWSAHRAAEYWNTKDPQRVVIDEVSGQHLALLLGGFWPRRAMPASDTWIKFLTDRVLWIAHPLGGKQPTGSTQLEIFVAGLYTFSGLRYLEAVPRAASRIAPRRLGNHGG